MRPHARSLFALALLATAPVFAQVSAQDAPTPASAPPVAEAPALELQAAEPPTADASDAPAADAVAESPAVIAPAAAATAPPANGADPRTDAEREFDALYAPKEVPLRDGNGDQGYDPVADPTLPAPANVPGSYDPWERYNRQMHRLNNAVDRRVARPLARTYVAVVPRPVRLGVSNFFNNLGQPLSAVNALLQGKPRQAAQSLGRFALNSTLGIGGVFDPASDAQLPNKGEDFGQTLGVWGWERSRYVELPLFGPRTVRDVVGMVGDAPLSPLRQVDADKVRIPIQGLQLVDVRTQLLSTDSLREGAEDDYALVRDAWSQRRNYQIFGDRQTQDGDRLPDYLLEENNPTVPVDAMPVMPTDGG
ncbi:VacJ family lipoprotein [Lysobacter koreensis]|uniref:VacJ family lipoprotein n=1 Tax=Lysobacter koreensis TaxID=266122 RepID=A0ABW2YN10_9GAMM